MSTCNLACEGGGCGEGNLFCKLVEGGKDDLKQKKTHSKQSRQAQGALSTYSELIDCLKGPFKQCCRNWQDIPCFLSCFGTFDDFSNNALVLSAAMNSLSTLRSILVDMTLDERSAAVVNLFR